ncbi:hypothetical protein B0H16DRAFT_1464932 [Mycena metata]|uniref:Glycoside hydrolase family 76 protein n=1 Tax=Mycena metata TaxID=1033252 RepID=A0AAD7ID29_9AGAR|nr:hypothetical protein B0H16DRAFT_1464932 [Mycena metata]
MLWFTFVNYLLGCALFSDSLAVPTLKPRILSSSWRKPTITQDPAERVSIASDALEKAIDNLSSVNQFDGQTYEVVGNVYSQMADFDRIANQTNHESSLQQFFAETQQTRPNFMDPLRFRTYGYAAIRAYAAYNNSVFLDYAIQSWSFGRAYTLTGSTTALTNKNFTLESGVCQNGATLAGGTFWTTTASDPDIAAMSSGYFLILSALLAEATSTPSFLDAANASANFIHTQLYNANGFVQQIVSGNQADSCKITNTATNSFNSGLFIEGLAVLASITSNAQTQNLLNTLITDVLSTSLWQTSDGIIANGNSKDGDSILVRALTAAYVRNVTTPEVHANLHDYIGVQFNALMDLATINGTNVYAAQWTGPPSSSFSESNQSSALAVLLGAAYLDPPNTTSTSASQSASTSSPRPASTPTAAIAGGVIGGLLFIAIIGVLFLLFRRRTRAQPIQPVPISSVSPFVSELTSPSEFPAALAHPTAPANDPFDAYVARTSQQMSNLPVFLPGPYQYPARPYVLQQGSQVTTSLVSATAMSPGSGSISRYIPPEIEEEEGEGPPPEYVAGGGNSKWPIRVHSSE